MSALAVLVWALAVIAVIVALLLIVFVAWLVWVLFVPRGRGVKPRQHRNAHSDAVADSREHLRGVLGAGAGDGIGSDLGQGTPQELDLEGEFGQHLGELGDVQQCLASEVRSVRRDVGRIAGVLSERERLASANGGVHAGEPIDGARA